MSLPSKVSVDQVHQKGHDGSLHVASGAVTLASAAVSERLIQVGANMELHLKFQVHSEVSATFELFEAPTFSAAGTADAPIRSNRAVSVPAFTATVTHTPTLSADGTLLYTQQLNGGRSIGGNETGLNEFILARGVDYLLRITSNAADNDVTWDYWMYED
jgi:hypothetical protein